MITKQQWIKEIFGQDETMHDMDVELSQEADECPPEILVDWIDEILIHPEMLQNYSKEQIGIGFNVIYSNLCSDYSYVYTSEIKEERKIQAIANLKYLYTNYFKRYCHNKITEIGNSSGKIDYICYMFWDIFVLYPEVATEKMIDAALTVMEDALYLQNESCTVSALHGLGHWQNSCKRRVSAIVNTFLVRDATSNETIIDYALNVRDWYVQ